MRCARSGHVLKDVVIFIPDVTRNKQTKKQTNKQTNVYSRFFKDGYTVMISVSNSVLNCQYRNRYNTGFSDLKTVFSGIESPELVPVLETLV
jgi:hypothetical protein